MNKQQLNLPASSIELANSTARLVNYLEQKFDLTLDESRWMVAGIIYNIPGLIELRGESKSEFTQIAQEIKSQRDSTNINHEKTSH
jgi:hypothetical protein